MLPQKQALWISIRRAAGFPQGFLKFWDALPEPSKQGMMQLPVQVPDAQGAFTIFSAFQEEFRKLENLLAVRKFRAKERREDDPHVIFQDVSKPKGLPIQSLVEDATRVVTEVSQDGLSVTVDRPWPQQDQPL